MYSISSSSLANPPFLALADSLSGMPFSSSSPTSDRSSVQAGGAKEEASPALSLLLPPDCSIILIGACCPLRCASASTRRELPSPREAARTRSPGRTTRWLLAGTAPAPDRCRIASADPPLLAPRVTMDISMVFPAPAADALPFFPPPPAPLLLPPMTKRSTRSLTRLILLPPPPEEVAAAAAAASSDRMDLTVSPLSDAATATTQREKPADATDPSRRRIMDVPATGSKCLGTVGSSPLDVPTAAPASFVPTSPPAPLSSPSSSLSGSCGSASNSSSSSSLIPPPPPPPPAAGREEEGSKTAGGSSCGVGRWSMAPRTVGRGLLVAE
mmetsp:Transcript_9241/g.26008  ORF Transcript_9241/g.26008 Transcript_9241/m.26008 type:complete len:328 (+) Transcript_9241:1068-2051(+)